MNPQTLNEFLDVRNHGFFRVAVISPQVVLGDPAACASSHIALINRAANQGAQYILAPELGLNGGYSLGDLQHNQVISTESMEALDHLIGETKDLDVIITVGVGLQINHFLLNTAITFCRRQILEVKVKEYLPNEGEFYEERHWATSDDLPFNEVRLLGEMVPIGDDIMIECSQYPGVKIFTTVCEADWVPVPSSGFAALAGATIIANVSASNVTIGKDEYREQLFGAASGRYNSAYMYSSAGFGESTSDLAWDGHIFVAERGSIVKRGNRYSVAGDMIVHDVDVEMLLADRKRQHSFRKNGQKYLHVLEKMRSVVVDGELGTNKDRYRTLLSEISPTPFVPITSEQRNKRCSEVFHQQATSLARRLVQLKSGKLFLGLSGGRDSTHALNIAVAAMDLLKRPRTDVCVLTLPGFGTDKRTSSNADELAQMFGVSTRDISIKEPSELMFRTIGFKPDLSLDKQPVVYENIQAWTRTQVLLATASLEKGMVLGTGDMSELAVGYCTLFADHPLHYGINAGVAKTLLEYLIEYAQDEVFKLEPEVQRVLADILATEITPGLQPLKEGAVVQKTEEIVGPYELIDFFLYYMVRFGFGPNRILRLATEAFAGKYEYPIVRKWLAEFLVNFFRSQFKRNIMADGPKIGLVSLNPRGDWRMPSDAEVTAWIDDLESTPEKL